MENEKNYVDGKLMILDEEDRNLSEAERQKKLMERKQQSSYDQSEFQQNQNQAYQSTSMQNNPYTSGTYPAHPLVNSYQYEPTSEYYLSQLYMVSLSKKDMQSLLKRKTINDLKILNQQQEYALARENQAAMNELEINKDFRIKNNGLWQKFEEKKIDSTDLKYEEEEFSLAPRKSADINFLTMSFFEKHHPIKMRSISSKSGWQYWSKDPIQKRFISITEKEFNEEYINFIFNHIADDEDIDDKKLRRGFIKLLSMVKEIDQSNLRIIKNDEIVFPNAIYNIRKGDFEKIQENTRIFNRFAILYEFKNIETPVFDKMLEAMFGKDEKIKKYVHEIIGAILSGVPLKKIFIFQGKSQGGKTRLANIIVKLLSEIGIYIFNDIRDISADWIKKNGYLYRLVYIKDSVDKRMAPTQRSNLKGFADGGGLSSDVPFKILICSNHKIYTGNDDYLENALKERLQVLIFANKMDTSDEEVKNFENMYFEMEAPGIIFKSLQAFHEVINNDNQFSLDFTINTCIEDDDGSILLSSGEESRITDILRKGTANPLKLKKIIDKIFVVTGEADDPNMTTQFIIDVVHQVDSDIEISAETLGNKLKEWYGENLKKDRNSKGYYYNLKAREIPPINAAEENIDVKIQIEG